MDTGSFTVPGILPPHRNLADGVNHNIIQSEIEGGVYLDRLPAGAELEVRTQNRNYRIVNEGEGRATISGHPKFCPEPVSVRIGGSSWGGSMLKMSFIGRGMHLEFVHPAYQTVTTSRIVEIVAR